MPDPTPAPIPVSNHPPHVPVGHFSNVSEPPVEHVSNVSGPEKAAADRGDTRESHPTPDTMQSYPTSEPATAARGPLGGADTPTKKLPPLARQAWNLARSLADFVADGCKTVTPEQYQARLEICDGCDHRRNNRCMKCGCRLSLKAQGRAFKCPAGKWPAAECD